MPPPPPPPSRSVMGMMATPPPPPQSRSEMGMMAMGMMATPPPPPQSRSEMGMMAMGMMATPPPPPQSWGVPPPSWDWGVPPPSSPSSVVVPPLLPSLASQPIPQPTVIERDYSEEIIEETTLTCAVCQDTYSDPRILPCLHSFCKGCLSKLASISTAVKCPLCRNEHTLSPKGVDELLPNTQLARKVETLSTTTEKSKCDQCEETNVVSFCSNCESFLCEFCDKAHKKMGIFKSHVLVLPKLAKKNPKVERGFICPKHTSESLTVYCISCKTIVCRDCGLYDHSGHKFKPAVEASDEIRKSLISDSRQLKTNLETFRSHTEEVAKVEKHVTIYPDTMKTFIISQFEDLQKLLNRRKEALLKEVDAQYNGFSKTLWAEKDIVETGICKLEAGIKFAQQLAKSDDKLEVAVLGTKALASNQVTKTLSWDPKAIKNLGPLAYAAQERDVDRGYIEKIGKITSIEITIKDGSYIDMGYHQCHDFQRNGKYRVQIEVKFDHPFKIVFPQMSLQCSCKRGIDVVPCTTECKQDKWEVTFQTKYSGSYTIEAILRINGEDYHKANRSISIGSGKYDGGYSYTKLDVGACISESAKSGHVSYSMKAEEENDGGYSYTKLDVGACTSESEVQSKSGHVSYSMKAEEENECGYSYTKLDVGACTSESEVPSKSKSKERQYKYKGSKGAAQPVDADKSYRSKAYGKGSASSFWGNF